MEEKEKEEEAEKEKSKNDISYWELIFSLVCSPVADLIEYYEYYKNL